MNIKTIAVEKFIIDMSLFSERYGYTKPLDVLIRECMPEEVCNVICTVYDELQSEIPGHWNVNGTFDELEVSLWCNFFHERRNEIVRTYGNVRPVAVPYFQDDEVDWYYKLDLIEESIKWMRCRENEGNLRKSVLDKFVKSINRYFKDLSYSYRIVNYEVVEITSEEEIKAIEEAISEAKDNVRVHLDKALELLSAKPVGDYRNSIKESISAVEAFCRELTGEGTLGKALNELEKSGVVVPKVLSNAFTNLYAYTNQTTTGIRHALMDESDKYVPDRGEATFMLVSCSAFLNYLRGKVGRG